MKIFYILIPVMILSGCKTQSTLSQSSQIETMEKSKCPNEGKCTIVAHKDSNLEIKVDGIGQMYPEITEGENIVIQYTYLKEAPEGIADGNYSESIYFEIPKGVNKLQKEGTGLSDVDLLYGRHFFSPESGFMRVESGKLSVVQKGNDLQIDLKFEIENVGQVISHIKETVTIE